MEGENGGHGDEEKVVHITHILTHGQRTCLRCFFLLFRPCIPPDESTVELWSWLFARRTRKWERVGAVCQCILVHQQQNNN